MSSELTRKIKFISENNGLILLYHSIAESVPDALQGTLHNVTPRVFKSHLEQLSCAFDFVSLNEFAAASQKKGLAAITFDDGYKNVIETALPVLEKFGYPLTFFLNSITLEHRWNWRDKVRYLIHHNLVAEFEKNYDFSFKQGRFYRYSKSPRNNSAKLDQALDAFLGNREIDIYGSYPYLTAKDLMLNHELITYGSHSHNHYVLASLTDQQQQTEIFKAEKILKSTLDGHLSRSFSAPFGGCDDVNSLTRQLIENCGYQDLLMSRQRLQPNQAEFEKVQLLERFMPRADDIVSEIAVI